MSRELKVGQKYHHFKGNDYVVLDVVNDVDTNRDDEPRKLVIYEAQYGERLKWARELNEFLSEVDHEKYPEVTQKYRFEEID